MQCLNFFQQVDSYRQILKSLTLISILAIAQKDVLSKLILMLFEYQLKIADLYNILTGNVEKLVPNFFD